MLGPNCLFHTFCLSVTASSSYHRSESAQCSAAVVSVRVEMALHRKCWGPEQVAADGAKRDTLASHPCHGYSSRLFRNVKLVLLVTHFFVFPESK